jgi:hypothetical protein
VGIFVNESSRGGDVIGGTSPADRDLISGNTGDGVQFSGFGSCSTTGSQIEGSYIGTDRNGTHAVANGGAGVALDSCAQSNTIGGTGAGAGNVISGNSGSGIAISGGNSNTIQGNLIGTTAAGTSGLGNGAAGVSVSTAASGVVMGGSTSATGVCDQACNTISGNAGSGVLIGNSATDAVHASLQRNLIYGNDTGGAAGNAEIQLFGQSPMACATTSTSGAPNDYLPCPQVQSPSGTSVTVKACAGCTVELFQASAGVNDQGSGGGLKLLGVQTDLTTPTCTSPPCTDTGSVTFSGVPSGVTLTATATNGAGTETSEFAQDTQVPTAARVTGFSVRRHGSVLDFHWRLASSAGVAGFNVYAGRHRLNRRLIPAHAGLTYHYRVRWAGSGPYLLRLVLNGAAQVAAGQPPGWRTR